jgi:catechol 2,3-dioxygenase-like lactoylglutathione lyase family enzyme
MKIGHIEIFVQDIQKAREFYQNVLGFDFDVEQGGTYIWLKHGELELLLRPGEKPIRSEKYQKTSLAIVLYTDDLVNEKKNLESRGLVFKGFDGSENCLTFTDPDGNWFQLVNPNE